jgi:hypothetical protein
MIGVEIHDMHPRGFLSFDLKEILHCLGEDAIERVWRCTNLEVTGDSTPELEAAERADTLISGERLLALAERTHQVIWGDFLGSRPSESTESLRIIAIDSSFWQVFGDEACLAKIRAFFTDVRPAAVDAG